MDRKPNVIFVFADQWRQQATGYSGNTDVQTPNLDALAAESINFAHAVSGMPVCCPYRASLLTGHSPLTHGVFMNDVSLDPGADSIGRRFSAAGYDTAYIGKWHVDGHGRSSFIPPERQQGFQYWKALECSHDYNRSAYYAGDSDEKRYWDGYDAIAQTRDTQDYIRSRSADRPFFLVLSWGPPHAPYHTAPDAFRERYDAARIRLRPNVPDEYAADARDWLAGYYAHCSALDACMGDLVATLKDCGIEDETILVFTSDHGDMLGSQGQTKKQSPWEESIRVPFLLRYPGLENCTPRETDALINAQDIMPTLLGLCSLPIPDAVEGLDFSDHIRGGADPGDGSVLLSCVQPFGQWNRMNQNAREYRGLRTRRYTYVRDLNGPWLLYDNEADPYQLRNLVKDSACRERLLQLEGLLHQKLDDCGDEFLPGTDYLSRWNYRVDASGTVPYTE